MLNIIKSRWLLAMAFGIVLLSFVDSAYSSVNYIKISVDQVEKSTEVDGIKMFDGTKVSLKMKVKEILEKGQIELKDGSIYYPEEIEFFLSKKKGSLKLSRLKDLYGPIFRSPEIDD